MHSLFVQYIFLVLIILALVMIANKPAVVQQLGDISLGRAIGYALLISLVLIVARLLCTWGASTFTRLASNFITVADYEQELLIRKKAIEAALQLLDEKWVHERPHDEHLDNLFSIRGF